MLAKYKYQASNTKFFMKNICVFCSSSNAVPSEFFDEAKELGKIIASNSYNLVYGGAKVGLMGAVANSVKENGGTVVGIIPKMIKDKELANHNCDELIITKDLRERKHIMGERSDAYIALPGGFGTFEEILEVLTLKQLDIESKPIVFVNTMNYYKHLQLLIEDSIKYNVMKTSAQDLYFFAENSQEAIEYIKNYKPSQKESKWFDVNINNQLVN